MLQELRNVSDLNTKAFGCFEAKMNLYILHATFMAVWFPLPKKHHTLVTTHL